MKFKTLINVTLTLGLAGSAMTVFAQDPIYPGMNAPVSNHYVKKEAKTEKALAKNQRWSDRQERKLHKRLAKEQKYDTLSSARGSEVKFMNATGEYVTLGYFDKNNNFRVYSLDPK